MYAWEEIGSTYAEAVTHAFPLHRAIIFATGFLLSLAIQQQTHLSALETIVAVPLSDLASFSTGFLAKATFGNVFWGAASTCAGVGASKMLIRLAYAVVDRATGASVKAATIDKSWIAGLSVEERMLALELVDSGMSEPRARLRAITSTNELLVGIGSICIVAAFWGNRLDGFVGALALAGAICSHLLAIHVFLKDYYGAALTKAHLQGKVAPNIAELT
ncbi:hypothetical protein [Hydrogenophaga sp.]|uniref:hypothetical protein n=1 Tax=Hydrogenophaga sp. TaxID=1904254 RepID=UPI002FC9BF97